VSNRPNFGWRAWACLTAALCLFPAMAAGAAEVGDRLELGFGIQGGWAELDEAGSAPTPFTLDDDAAFGAMLGLAWRLSEQASLELEIAAAEFGSSLEGVSAKASTGLLGLRYRILSIGGVGPYLRGAYGGAQTRLASDDGEATLDLNGKAALFGLGLRLAVSPRVQFDLELNHTVISYDDAAVVLENVYAGTRLDKAGSLTRLQLAGRWLFW
jgi:hypothetical protein